MAGRLNKRIVIEHTVESEENITGEELRASVSNMAVRAEVQWRSGRRETSNMEVVFSYDATFIVWLHYQAKISEGDIVHYAGKKFVIVSLETEPETRILYIRAQTL